MAPRTLLAWLRLLVAARHLGDTATSGERIGVRLGYASGPAFRNACHKLVGAAPVQIREGGGLWFAASRFQTALAAHRAEKSVSVRR